MSPAKAVQSSPGLMVVIVLSVLTLVEYLVSTTDIPGALLWIALIAVAKAVMIITYFMHIGNIFKAKS